MQDSYRLSFVIDSPVLAWQVREPSQQQLRINRRPTRFTVAFFQLLPDELEADVLVDQPQQMFGNLIFQTE